MRGVVLSPRLKTVASLIEKGGSVADVGTDHARLPVWLVQNGISDRVVASDIRPGPLSRAEALIRRCGLSAGIRLVLCDGLDLIAPGDAGTVVLAGLGGEAIRDILRRAPWVKENGRRLVLQPMTSADALREYLFTDGYGIKAERLTPDGGRLYQTILAAAGKMELSSPVGLYTGIYLKYEEHYERFLDALIRRFEKACRGMKKASRAYDPVRGEYYGQVLDGLKKERSDLYGRGGTGF